MGLSKVAEVFIARLTNRLPKVGGYERLWPKGHGQRRVDWLGKVSDPTTTLASIRDEESRDGVHDHLGAGNPASWSNEDQLDFLLIKNIADRSDGWDATYAVLQEYVKTVYVEGIRDGYQCCKANPSWTEQECVDDLLKVGDGTAGDEHDSY